MKPKNRIDELFARKRAEGKPVLIIYLTAGFPRLEETEELLLTLEKAGADLIELGVPFSDPIADGPTIQHASTHSLNQGTSLSKILELVSSIRQQSKIPLVLFSSVNPLLKYGLPPLVNEAQQRRIDGLLVPDLPLEEGAELEHLCQVAGLKLIYLIAPTTPAERRRLIAEHSTGFIYYVSVKGVTGARDTLPEDLKERLNELRQLTNKPVVVGFGISRREHVEEIKKYADGVVIGSAIIKLIANSLHEAQEERKRLLASFIGSLKL